MSDQAFVTLATNDSYAKGAMVLGQSLRNHNTTKKLVALIGPNVAEACREALASIFDEVRVVDVMDSGDSAHLALMKRPDLGVTFTKLHCWTLTQYSKCVFMDADTLVLSNIDELFEREELSAAPDPGWPDCFNSGVFVFRPSKETHERLLTFCDENGSFDGKSRMFLSLSSRRSQRLIRTTENVIKVIKIHPLGIMDVLIKSIKFQKGPQNSC
uniref:glycogenin glucosyltransferase n=1 Tax=Echeneis naucrates TaxID=173247 RepID=A0A665V9S8_ECHNA